MISWGTIVPGFDFFTLAPRWKHPYEDALLAILSRYLARSR